MARSLQYEEVFYSSYSIELENLSVTITLDGGILEKEISTSPFHDHPVFEMQAVTKGELLLKAQENLPISVKEGGICLIPPDVYHLVSAKENTRRLTMRFSFHARPKENCEDLFSRFNALKTLTPFENAEPIISLLKNIREETLSQKTASAPLCRAYLCELFLLLYRRLIAVTETEECTPLSEKDDASARYNKIEILMQQHIREPICEEDLANALGLSIRQTSRVMQNVFGMSFRKKLAELRLHYAKGLLITTEMPVDKIAEEIGYTSPSGFHIAFRKAFGCTPIDYREQNLAE